MGSITYISNYSPYCTFSSSISFYTFIPKQSTYHNRFLFFRSIGNINHLLSLSFASIAAPTKPATFPKLAAFIFTGAYLPCPSMSLSTRLCRDTVRFSPCALIPPPMRIASGRKAFAMFASPSER